MQQTDFAVELVIGEDCSTDGTRAIVQDYGRRHPERIRLLLPEQNLGMMRNAVATFAACRGQYVAILEGDDYWTDPSKLQNQVDFLDAHPDCAICFHNVTVMPEDGNRLPWLHCPPDQKAISTLEDLLQRDFLPTLSVMFRRGLFGEFPAWYLTMGVGDWPHHILNAEHGDIGYLNEVMAVYRKHRGGVYASRSYDRRFDDVVRMYDALSPHFDHRYDRILAEAKRRHTAELLVEKVKATASFEEGIAVARSTLDRWQELYGLPGAWCAKALGRVYVHYLFASRDGRVGRRTARHCFLRMIRHDPSWLRNPGVWSVALDAYLGPKAAQWLRALRSGWLQTEMGD
jgi:glycosyltransferase involved in cell wall biosynthesis